MEQTRKTPVKDASCRAVGASVALLRRKDLPVEGLVHGLPVTLAQLEDPNAWLDWNSFCEITERVADLLGGPQAFADHFRDFADTPVMPILHRVVALAVSPRQIYKLLVLWLGKRLYPVVDHQLEVHPDGRFHVRLEIDPSLRGCELFFQGAHGAFCGVPTLIGLGESVVEADLGTHHGDYWISPPPSRSILARLSRTWDVLIRAGHTIDELTEQQAALHESTAALRERERQLFQVQKMEAVGRLAGGIAHDFNNLMTAVLGYSDLLEDAVEEPEARELIGEVRVAAERATDLTRQLLAFSRRQVFETRNVQINDTVREMEPMLRRMIGEDVELVSELDANLPAVSADPSQLEQVVLNLIVNARDALPEGGSIQVVTRRIVESEQEEVELVVTDDGIGMDEETQGRVFEPFFTTKGVGHGTGLGLSTVHGVVHQTGGSIRIESKSHHGTSFILRFPAVASEAAPRAVRAQRRGRGEGGTETILLVEDEATVRGVSRRMLEGAGYRVLETSNAAAALEQLEGLGGRVDLVLSDVRMRGMTGVKLAEEATQRWPELRVLLMSGFSGAEMLPGGWPFLPKPFTQEALLGHVRTQLDEPPPRPGSEANASDGE